MRLKLAVAGKEIASVPLDAAKAGNRDYINAKRRLLTMANLHVLTQLSEAPVYYIEVRSKMNRKAVKA